MHVYCCTVFNVKLSSFLGVHRIFCPPRRTHKTQRSDRSQIKYQFLKHAQGQEHFNTFIKMTDKMSFSPTHLFLKIQILLNALDE